MLIQFLLSAVLLFALGMTWRRLRQQAISSLEAFGWSVLWIAAGILIWQPNVTTIFANKLGIGRGADLLLYASVIGFLILVFQLHVAHDRLDRKLTDLVRRDALRDLPTSSDEKK